MKTFSCYRLINGEWQFLSNHSMETVQGLASIAEQLTAFAMLAGITIRLVIKEQHNGS